MTDSLSTRDSLWRALDRYRDAHPTLALPIANFEAELHSAWLSTARDQQRRLFSQLREHQGTWPLRTSRSMRRVVRRTLTSANLQWLSLYEAMKCDGSEARRNEFIVRYGECLDRALGRDQPDVDTRLNPYAASTEILARRRYRKLSGGHRTVFVYGMFMRARHRLLLSVLRSLVAPTYFRYQWMHTGQSRQALLGRIRSTCNPESGFSHVAVIDIADFFGSISHRFLLAYLPFDHDVVTNIVHPLQAEGGQSRTNLNEMVRNRSLWAQDMAYRDSRLHDPQRGVPQGASCSPFIAYSILEDALAGLASACSIFQWGDDIVIFGRSRDEVTDTSRRLSEVLRNHPAGPLIGQMRTIGPIADGFEFHGHRFARGATGIGVTLTSRARERFFENLQDRIGLDVDDGDALFLSATQYAHDWLAQALCDERFVLATQALDLIRQARLRFPPGFRDPLHR
jgi:hypothetical protein